MPQTSRTGSSSTQTESSGPTGSARAFSMLPPGTVSPVMASVIISQGASAQLEIVDRRSEEAKDAADTAKKTAGYAKQAAVRAEEVARTEPSDPHAAEVARRALQAQREALVSAQHAELAAYQLEQARQLSGLELLQAPPSGASDRRPSKTNPAAPQHEKIQSSTTPPGSTSPDATLHDATPSSALTAAPLSRSTPEV